MHLLAFGLVSLELFPVRYIHLTDKEMQ